MKRYQAFVFDFDGVLADSVEVKTRAFEKLYLHYGAEVAAKVVDHHRKNGGMPRRAKFAIYEADFINTPADEARLDQLSAQFSDIVVDQVADSDEIPGVEMFLNHWAGKLPLFVDSASPDDELTEIIARRGMTDYFKLALGSNQTKASNLNRIIEQYGFDPDCVLFFGDATSDLKAAQQCGTDFIGIVRDFHSPLRADDIIAFEDFYQVQDYLESLSS